MRSKREAPTEQDPSRDRSSRGSTAGDSSGPLAIPSMPVSSPARLPAELWSKPQSGGQVLTNEGRSLTRSLPRPTAPPRSCPSFYDEKIPLYGGNKNANAEEKAVSEAVSIAKFRRAHSLKSGFQTAASRTSSSGWSVLKNSLVTAVAKIAAGETNVPGAPGLGAVVSVARDRSKVANQIKFVLDARRKFHSPHFKSVAPAKTIKIKFEQAIHESYSLDKGGCSVLDWTRLDSRDAVQLYKSSLRFSDAVQGVYNMQGHATLDGVFAKCGFRSPRFRGGTCLLEIKIQCRDLPGHGLTRNAPDAVCEFLVFNLKLKRWRKEWESDIQLREFSPTFRRILRIEIPDGGNTHGIFIILDKSRFRV